MKMTMMQQKQEQRGVNEVAAAVASLLRKKGEQAVECSVVVDTHGHPLRIDY